MKQYTFVYAGPGCGKSVLGKRLIQKGEFVVDTDSLLFGWLIRFSDVHKLKEELVGPKGPREQVFWDGLTAATLVLADKIASANGGYLLTNLCPDKLDSPAISKSYSFFRKPEDLVAVIDDRRAAKAKVHHVVKREGAKLKEAKSWYDAWKRNSDMYDEAVELKTGEYLSNFFLGEDGGYDPNASDAGYDFLYPKLNEQGYFDVCWPGPREEGENLTDKCQSQRSAKSAEKHGDDHRTETGQHPSAAGTEKHGLPQDSSSGKTEDME